VVKRRDGRCRIRKEATNCRLPCAHAQMPTCACKFDQRIGLHIRLVSVSNREGSVGCSILVPLQHFSSEPLDTYAIKPGTQGHASIFEEDNRGNCRCLNCIVIECLTRPYCHQVDYFRADLHGARDAKLGHVNERF
jgi:hypothetical protein